MRRLLALRGVTPNGHLLWTPQEAGDLRANYPDYHSALLLIRRRTRPAAYSKAGRLRITKPAAPPWTDNEILRLRKVYPSGTRQEILAAFPGRSFRAIGRAANARGVFRFRQPLKPTGCRALDQILQRARDRNVSLIELGKEAGNISYFSNKGWRNGKLNWPAISRAAEFLGGRLRARWPGEMP